VDAGEVHSNRRIWCTVAAMGPLGGAVPCKDATTASKDEAVSNFSVRRVQQGGEEDGGRR
jgi:hypothetical protein